MPRPASQTPTSIFNTLLPTTTLTRAPAHSTFPHMTSTISSIQLHPALEATLHILNADLPSAHFLTRHMSGPPAVEGMLLHGILHRAEGDFSNARAWTGDVRDACEGWVPKKRGEEKLEEEVLEQMKGGSIEKGESLVEFVYGEGSGEMEALIDDVEKFRGKKGGGEEEIEERIRKELGRVFEWCKRKFGEGAWMDASEAWVQPSDEVRSIGQDMVSGDKRWRKF